MHSVMHENSNTHLVSMESIINVKIKWINYWKCSPQFHSPMFLVQSCSTFFCSLPLWPSSSFHDFGRFKIDLTKYLTARVVGTGIKRPCFRGLNFWLISGMQISIQATAIASISKLVTIFINIIISLSVDNWFHIDVRVTKGHLKVWLAIQTCVTF